MPRREMQEIHDHPIFPVPLRDLVTDALQSLWNFGDSYRPILPRLLEAMQQAGTQEVLDLCSGGGGPWLRLLCRAELENSPGIQVRLTDKYPNRGAFRRATEVSMRLSFEAGPIDAASVPERLGGFRTIFSSFHHFAPDAARRLLADAMDLGRGVGVFEVAMSSPRTVLTILLTPLLVLWIAPSIRPFRWSRLFWTYLVPVVPFVILYDGLVSCLRAYSREQLEELVQPLRRPGYVWRIGEERGGFLPVTYLLGYPAPATPDSTTAWIIADAIVYT